MHGIPLPSVSEGWEAPAAPAEDAAVGQLEIGDTDLLLQFGSQSHVFQDMTEERFHEVLALLQATDAQRAAMMKGLEKAGGLPPSYGQALRDKALSRYRTKKVRRGRVRAPEYEVRSRQATRTARDGNGRFAPNHSHSGSFFEGADSAATSLAHALGYPGGRAGEPLAHVAPALPAGQGAHRRYVSFDNMNFATMQMQGVGVPGAGAPQGLPLLSPGELAAVCGQGAGQHPNGCVTARGPQEGARSGGRPPRPQSSLAALGHAPVPVPASTAGGMWSPRHDPAGGASGTTGTFGTAGTAAHAARCPPQPSSASHAESLGPQGSVGLEADFLAGVGLGAAGLDLGGLDWAGAPSAVPPDGLHLALLEDPHGP